MFYVSQQCFQEGSVQSVSLIILEQSSVLTNYFAQKFWTLNFEQIILNF